MFEHDGWFFIGILGLIFFLWILIGGPARPISFSGPTLSTPDALGGGTYLSFPRAPFDIGTGNVSLPGSSDGSSYGGGSFSYQMPDLSGVGFGTPSPYRGIVRLNHYVSGAAGDPTKEYLELSVSGSATVPINISGWSFYSEAGGRTVTIPQGTETPTTGTINASTDIEIAPGHRAILISGRSPIGASFRENKCIGYFSTFQTFSPPLPQSCPIPEDEMKKFYPNYVRDAFCQDYVKTRSRCQVNLSPPVNASNGCANFLTDRLHYNGCLSAHKNDVDFLGDTWRVYLGSTVPLWRTKYEVIKLLDKQGKTVDAFKY